MHNSRVVSIHQPNYLPWIGYFSKIKASDIFVFFDDVQFERGKTYTSRTKILNQGKEQWLTVPVLGKGQLLDIKDITCDNTQKWQTKHLKNVQNTYRKAPYFEEVYSLLETMLQQKHDSLFEYNSRLIVQIISYLGIETKCINSSSLGLDTALSGLDKIIEILKTTQATEYLSGSGSGSKRYIDESVFAQNNIKLTWQAYSPISYKQLYNDHFIPNLSIVDLLFMQGKNAISFL